MVYLADWKSAIERDTLLTNIQWVFNHYGPYVEDVVKVADSDPAFKVIPTTNMFGDFKEIINVRGNADYPSLEEEEKEILDFVISSTASKNWDQFLRLIYSTYPMISRDRFSDLDLVELAREYKEDPLLSSTRFDE
jgi:hypothetical protein